MFPGDSQVCFVTRLELLLVISTKKPQNHPNTAFRQLKTDTQTSQVRQMDIC